MREPSAPQKMFVYGTLMKGFYHYEKALVGQEVSLSLPGPAAWYGI